MRSKLFLLLILAVLSAFVSACVEQGSTHTYTAKEAKLIAKIAEGEALEKRYDAALSSGDSQQIAQVSRETKKYFLKYAQNLNDSLAAFLMKNEITLRAEGKDVTVVKAPVPEGVRLLENQNISFGKDYFTWANKHGDLTYHHLARYTVQNAEVWAVMCYYYNPSTTRLIIVRLGDEGKLPAQLDWSKAVVKFVE